MESYGERTQTRIFENHANLLAGAIKCQGGPFLGFAQAFSVHILFEKTSRMGSY